MCVFSLLGNFECGNPEKLKSKCIPVMEAQEYIAVSRLQCAPFPGGPGAFVLIPQALRGFFSLFVLCLLSLFLKKKNCFNSVN